MRRLFYGIAILAILGGSYAHASCCSQASSGGAGRLLPHERALVQFGGTVRYSYGGFDQRSHFVLGNKEKMPHLIVDQEAQVMFRIFRHLEPFAKVTGRLQKSPLGLGANVANSLVGARIPLLGAGEFGVLPAIAAIASWEIPTGVASGQNREYRAEYITSMGVHMLNLALFFEKSFEPLSLVLGYGLAFEAPFGRGEIVAGHVHSPSVAMNFAFDESNFLSMNLLGTFVAPMHMNDKPISNSSKRKIALSVSYAKKIHSHITLLAALGSDVPIDYFGNYTRSEAFINFGMRFGVF